VAKGLTDLWQTVARAYDLGPVVDVAAEPARGLQGQVWRLTTDAGTWAVKETFGPITEDEARTWGDFQEAARRAGVPAPPVRRTHDGRHLSRIAGRSIRVHGWVDIDDPDSGLDPALVGAVVARLHQVSRPAAGAPHWWYTEPVGAASWDELVDASQAADAPFADRLAAIRDDLVALELTMTPMDPVQTCHLDLWADNVRSVPGVTGTSGAGTGGICVIDWDNSGPADPTRELALVVFEFARTEPARASVLAASYRDEGGPGRLRMQADFAMLAAQLGHIGAMHLRRWLDPASSAVERARAAEGIEEFVDNPLTPKVVSELLNAVC
jgi:Ser/Thr protein kinase RdoA (MazF antagonist)